MSGCHVRASSVVARSPARARSGTPLLPTAGSRARRRNKRAIRGGNLGCVGILRFSPLAYGQGQGRPSGPGASRRKRGRFRPAWGRATVHVSRARRHPVSVPRRAPVLRPRLSPAAAATAREQKPATPRDPSAVSVPRGVGWFGWLSWGGRGTGAGIGGLVKRGPRPICSRPAKEPCAANGASA